MKTITFQGKQLQVTDKTNPGSFRHITEKEELGLVKSAKEAYRKSPEINISFAYHPVYQDALYQAKQESS